MCSSRTPPRQGAPMPGDARTSPHDGPHRDASERFLKGKLVRVAAQNESSADLLVRDFITTPRTRQRKILAGIGVARRKSFSGPASTRGRRFTIQLLLRATANAILRARERRSAGVRRRTSRERAETSAHADRGRRQYVRYPREGRAALRPPSAAIGRLRWQNVPRRRSTRA